MRFAALSTGAGAPAGDFAGAIAAVHRRVCVISLVDESPLTLATLEIGRLPRGITLDAPPEFTFHGIVARGADIAARGGILRIGGGALSIDLRPATPWRSRLGDLSLDGAREAVTQALEIARAALRQDGRGEALVRIAGARLGALNSATRAFDVAAAGDAMSALVGLGEGVTPAGDDYLVGYFAGLWTCAGRDVARVRLSRRAARATDAIRVADRRRQPRLSRSVLRWRGVGTAFRCCRRDRNRIARRRAPPRRGARTRRRSQFGSLRPARIP